MRADMPVVITRDGCMRGIGNLSDVSLSGAMLNTALKVPEHSNITVSPVDSNDGTHDVFACVVRTHAGGVTIEWRDMASPQVIALIESVSSYCAGLQARDPCAA